MKEFAGKRVLMLIENSPYPLDVRVNHEALSLKSAGYQISVICQRGKREPFQETIDDIFICRYPSPPKGEKFFAYLLEYSYSFVAMFFLSFYVWGKRGFDIIHTANPPDTAVFLGIFFKLFGKKFIFDYHDLVPELYLARAGKRASHLVYQLFLWLEKITFRYSDYVIATNQSYKKIAMERGNVPENRIMIVRNGPDLDQIKPVPVDPYLKKKDVLLIGYVGMIGLQDGLDYLLRALQKLKFDLGKINFYCVIIGKGNILADLKDQSHKLGLADVVRFTGFISEEEKLKYLSSIDVGVDPDPMNGFNEYCTMVKMMEYMAFGKPIVSFDLPEHRVTAQGAAFYAKPNDELDFARCIVQLMENPELREQMGEIGRDLINNTLAWKHQAKNLLEAYNRLYQ